MEINQISTVILVVILLLPVIVHLIVKYKNSRLPGFPRILIETSINVARLIANEQRALLTWHKGVRLIWDDWDLGKGKINRRLTVGDILLVKGKWNNIYILVVYDAKPEESNPNQPIQPKLWYHFQTIFTGVIWNRMTYKGSRIW